MPEITMICFANSRKLGGRCVAGLAWDGKDYSIWVRPVSECEHGELNAERLYADRSDPQLLDIIDLEVLEQRPSGCHVEDTLIGSKKKWSKRGRLAYSDALKFVSDALPPLWVDGKSTAYGCNDAIEAVTAETLTSSLRLISPKELKVTATSEGWENKRKVRGSFRLGRTDYTLSVTDPRIEKEFGSLDVGSTRTIEKPILCISIGEVFEKQNCCYKLIAGVMEK